MNEFSPRIVGTDANYDKYLPQAIKKSTEELEPEEPEPEEHMTYEWTMFPPFWAVMSKGTGEVIIQLKFIRQEDGSGNRELVDRLVSQFYEEAFEDCGDQVEIRLIEPVETKLDPTKEKNGTDSRIKGTD